MSVYDLRYPSYLTPRNMGGMNLSLNPSVTSRPTTTAPTTRPPAVVDRTERTVNPMLNNLMGQISRMSPTVTRETQSTTNQNRSPELEAMIQSLTDQFNTRSQETAGAYDAYAATFDELQRSLADRYNTSGSAASTNALNSALSSGLTPAEAQAMSQEALLAVMQDYNPAAAELASGQAEVGVRREDALTNLMERLQLPIAQNVMAPYYRDVAGTRQTGTETTTDPMRRISALLQAANMMEESRLREESDALGWAQLAENSDQFTRDLALRQASLGQSGSQFNQELALKDRLARMGESGSMDRVLAQLMNQQIMQANLFDFNRDEGQLAYDRDLDKLMRTYMLNNVGFGVPNSDDNFDLRDI